MKRNPTISFVTEYTTDVDALINAQNEGVMPILTLRDNLLFPGTVTPITIGRKKSLRLIRKAEKDQLQIAVFAQRNPDTEDPGYDDLYHVGTVCRVIHLMKLPDGNYNALLQASNRCGLDSMITTSEGNTGRVANMP